jgi:hypothetical protein
MLQSSGTEIAPSVVVFPQSGIQKTCDQNNEVTKLEAALQATSRRALTTVLAVLGACQSEVIILAKVNAGLDRHVCRVRVRYRSERARCRAVPIMRLSVRQLALLS